MSISTKDICSGHYEDFDWQSLSKKELVQLYDMIIDEAYRNPRYRTHVMHQWKVSAYELHKLTLKRFVQRRNELERKRNLKHKIAFGLESIWHRMTGAEAKADFKWLKEQIEYKNPN